MPIAHMPVTHALRWPLHNTTISFCAKLSFAQNKLFVLDSFKEFAIEWVVRAIFKSTALNAENQEK